MLALSTLALLCSAVWAKEMAVNELKAAELYDSGIVHEELMARKMNHWAAEAEAGLMESVQYPELGYTKCINGIAEAIPGDAKNTFRCNNVVHADLQSTGRGSSSWGWTSDDGREFIAMGQEDGAAFVEIKGGKMVYLGRLPQYSVPSIWREIRSYKHYMVIGSEAVGHGVQFFDMRKVGVLTHLLTLDPASPKTFDGKLDLAGHFNELPVGRTHNVVINEDLGYVVAVGAQPRNSTCKAGLIFIDVSDISNPTTPGCSDLDGYVHDAQCLVYKGPDKKYQGRDICYGYNEDTLTIYDVTNQLATSIISRTSYEGAAYTHQGWVLDKNNQEYLLLDDELDEENAVGPGADGFPVTFIWDIRSLEKPKQTGFYKSSTKAIDHNQYIIDGLSYQSQYGAGLRILDVSSIPRNPTGADVCEVGFFDIFPEDDTAPGGGLVHFVGTWSSYAYFKSGYIFINTIERGAFLVKMTSLECPTKPVCHADNCLRAFRASSVTGRLTESQKFCGEIKKKPVSEVSEVPAFAPGACTGDTVARVSSASAPLAGSTWLGNSLNTQGRAG
ncbi:hypothetical protein BJ875DRAFT_444182 [Amylocarpus encephaloides]|uniref:Regulatory P domain-containing protein n=1 Tax=Amylocarpus encephaloides TaxID=45428 RepID=A0A9P7YCF7_9HELO|nr:hypothetical protein BJ875DRAFT_444182 [Amylocarpus encephaloides]